AHRDRHPFPTRRSSDLTQGVEAQTLANLYLALDADLELVPVVNKIDLPAALPEDVAHEVEDLIGIAQEDVIPISAKMGTNVDQRSEEHTSELQSRENLV